jgi:imidazolonepropionase-like amidohydrolase
MISLMAVGPAAAFALTHAAVIDVRTGAIATDRTIVVVAGRILAVGASDSIAAPADIKEIDAGGAYVVPGLWDMHVHLHDASFLPLLVAEGVTGVREMGDDPAVIGDWRKEIASGDLLGPRIVMAGLILDGPDPTWPAISRPIRTAEEARAAVRDAKRAGWDFIKVYNGLSREAYDAILDEARSAGLAVAGHVPFAVGATAASDAGQRSIEHLTGILEGCTARPRPLPAIADHDWYLAHYDSVLADSLFARFVKNGTWQVPTLVLRRTYAQFQGFAAMDDPRLAYIPSAIENRWRLTLQPRSRGPGARDPAREERLFHADERIVGAMQGAGVRMLAGTDLGNPFLYPGFSLHDELGLLVESGLTPLEALRAATLGPAEYFGATDSMGTVEPGKVADFVILRANPLEDIANVSGIEAVCVRGRLLGRATLDALLAQVRKRASLH